LSDAFWWNYCSAVLSLGLINKSSVRSRTYATEAGVEA
jgi:hypothetical protein